MPAPLSRCKLDTCSSHACLSILLKQPPFLDNAVGCRQDVVLVDGQVVDGQVVEQDDWQLYYMWPGAPEVGHWLGHCCSADAPCGRL